jgi:glycosyltransferase involved in cell wall biosynthesis
VAAVTRLLWHSNAPWSPTGYGQQTAQFAPLLAEKYELAISSFYGLEGAPRGWKGIPVLPGIGGEYGSQSMLDHAERWFGGARNGIVLTLMDVWVLDNAKCQQMNIASWVPVDHEPAPEIVVDFFVQTGAIPIAMSKFGERQLGRLDPLYVPHGIDTSVYRPHDKQKVRGGSFSPDAFVIGMVAANKGRPSRKGFVQALRAFAKFIERHDNAFLHLHTMVDPTLAQGENIPALIRSLKIPIEKVRIADAYKMVYEPYTHEEMAQIYSAFDVLLNPSLGEGFGIPIIEAQACGVPVIVTDFSSMTELCGAGWLLQNNTPYWTGQSSWQAAADVDDIVNALEQAYDRNEADVQCHSEKARAFAEQYDYQRVWKQHWLPTLRTVEQRFGSQEPVTIPPRAKAAA